ncbi:MAG: hypothetical protein WC932_04935 [archaeon]
MGSNSYLSSLSDSAGKLSIASTVANKLLGRDKGYTDMSAQTGSEEKYVTDYYAGSQVAIFMGDLWLSDITMIQYQATQNKRPFWGYKSKKFDVMAQGTQLIQGVFSMNYTHTNFLNMAVAEWRKRTVVPDKNTEISEDEIQRFLTDIKATSDPYLLKDLAYSPSGVMNNQNNQFNNLDKSAKQALLEQFFWGADDVRLTSTAVIQPDDLPPFDITITFGNYPSSRDNPNSMDEFTSAHTVKALTGVHITDSSMQIGISGEPIQEIFTFVARALDTPLTRVPKQFIVPPKKSEATQ